MFGAGELPWVLSTILHLYAITAFGVTALMLYQASSRAIGAVRN